VVRAERRLLRSGQLPLPDCVGQVGHPLRRLRVDLLQGQSAPVHALEQADFLANIAALGRNRIEQRFVTWTGGRGTEMPWTCGW
jgi:hypothetical protein